MMLDFFLAKYGTDNCDCTIPLPSFGFEQNNSSQLVYTFTYSGTDYDSIEWDFGDDTSSEANPEYTFSETGSYNVCVTVSN